MPDYPITPGTVTAPFCPTTWQQILEEFAARYSVTLPSINGFVAQASTPAVSDQDKVWVKTSAAAPYVLGIYTFQGGGWRAIPAPVGFTYFVDTGAANVWTISTGESIPDNAAFIIGRLWAVKVNASVSGATTLQIDSFTAKAVKKQNDNDLVAGDVEAGQVVLCIYDATAGQFELITTLGAVTSPYASAVVKRKKAFGVASQAVPANAETTVEFTDAIDPSGLITSFVGNQITLPTGTYQFSVWIPLFATGAAVAVTAFLRDVTGGSVALAYGTSGNAGGSGDWSSVVINHVVTVSGATNIYDVRIFSRGDGVDLGHSASSASYEETYQSMTILRIAR